MKKILLALALVLIPGFASAQCSGVFPANTVCGATTSAPPKPIPFTNFPAGLVVGTSPITNGTNQYLLYNNNGILGNTQALPNGVTATTQATTDRTTKVATDVFVGAQSGVFNPRTQYGAVPDGSTDNSTAIAAAFAASNTFVSGIPTVYFDCNTGSTTCVYNYGGSGISPINPLVATTILCAPGATLNYTGSAHAADIGPTNLSVTETKPYKIQGCRWTGGASYTQGIVINNFLIMTEISENIFNNFGNQTGYNIRYGSGSGTTNNWEATIKGNFWYDSDGFTRNMVDAHLIANGATQITNNAVECIGPANAACSTVTYGVGFWVHSAWITSNSIQFHYPNIRIANSPTSSTGVHVINNHFEGNSGGPKPCITYGDPGGTAANIGAGSTFISNFFYCPSSVNSPIVGPETPASGSYSLVNTYWDHNALTAQFGFSAAAYINTNGGSNNLYGYNTDASNVYITPNTTPAITDFAGGQKYGVYSYPQQLQTQVAGKPIAWDSTGTFTTPAGYVELQATQLCPNTTASGTAQVCLTTPHTDTGGNTLPLVAGNTITYITNTANTGSLSVSVNGTAYTVKKNGGTANLGAGDIKVGIPYFLSFDGTNLNLPNTFAVQGLTGLTFATLPTPSAGMQAYITDGLAAACGDGACTTWGTTVTAGAGALKLQIWYNGTNWTLAGK